MRFLLIAVLVCHSGLLLAQTAGRVEAVEGDVRIYDAAQNERPAKRGETVGPGDSIVTGSDGELHLAMEDDGQLALRPNTRMRIAAYKADGGSDDTSVISLLAGALRSVTGWIGKYNPKGYAIRTPTATIGVRGTDHETVVVAKASADGEAGTYDKVNEGATVLSTPYGQTEVRPGRAGFASLAGGARPRLLASVPAVFRPARFDARFRGLHEKTLRQLDERRRQRIETLKTRQLPREHAADAGQRKRGRLHGDATAGQPDEKDQKGLKDRNRREQLQRHERAEQRRQGNREHYEQLQRRMEAGAPDRVRPRATDRRSGPGGRVGQSSAARDGGEHAGFERGGEGGFGRPGHGRGR